MTLATIDATKGCNMSATCFKATAFSFYDKQTTEGNKKVNKC